MSDPTKTTKTATEENMTKTTDTAVAPGEVSDEELEGVAGGISGTTGPRVMEAAIGTISGKATGA